MNETVSTLARASLRGVEYIFLLLNETPYQGEVQKALNATAESFGNRIGLKGSVISVNPEKSSDCWNEELCEKAWPQGVTERIGKEESPFLVIFQTDFLDFDPSQDDWRIVWFGQAKRARDNIPKLFQAFDKGLQRNEHPFEYLDRVRNPTNGHAPFGQVIGPGDNIDSDGTDDATVAPHNCLAEGWGLISEVIRIAQEEGLTSVDGRKGHLVREACQRLHVRGFLFAPRSVTNALTRKNKWAEIEAALIPANPA